MNEWKASSVAAGTPVMLLRLFNALFVLRFHSLLCPCAPSGSPLCSPFCCPLPIDRYFCILTPFVGLLLTGPVDLLSCLLKNPSATPLLISLLFLPDPSIPSVPCLCVSLSPAHLSSLEPSSSPFAFPSCVSDLRSSISSTAAFSYFPPRSSTRVTALFLSLQCVQPFVFLCCAWFSLGALCTSRLLAFFYSFVFSPPAGR
mmetsp:Transcript_27252/g.53503  ORF Transcript_27252/g.53503 Transcript_27252/m.53503 type:complete len:201 (+) Transcript_27252:59-661(+)